MHVEYIVPCLAAVASVGNGSYSIASADHLASHLPLLDSSLNLKWYSWSSLVAQWLRICLPMQGTWVWALVREDPTCRGAAKPVCHNYWACALEPASHNYWGPCVRSPCSTTREATAMRSPHTATKSSPRSPQLEEARTQQRRPNAAKINKINK